MTPASYISDLIDEMYLDKPLDFESFNFEAVKETAIVSSIEHYQSIINNPNLSSEEKQMSVLAVIAYLQIENAMLWIDKEKRDAGRS